MKAFRIEGPDALAIQLLAGEQVIFIPVELLVHNGRLAEAPDVSEIPSFMESQVTIDRFPDSLWLIVGYDDRRQQFVVINSRMLV